MIDDRSEPAGDRLLDHLQAIPSQAFRMGSDRHYPEESPSHDVATDSFGMESHQVTNRQFARFAQETGYRTLAERPLDPADFPGAPAENLQPGSMVFVPTTGPVDLRHLNLWWRWTPGASWRHPEGRESSVVGREDHPVVHIAYEDAEAYAGWAGRSLPTEAEWEAAARGGLDQAPYVWGDAAEAPDERLANYWHGDFPWRPEPGYGATTAVGSYPANPYGLHDMAGNVWEWTSDWYASRHPDGHERPVLSAAKSAGSGDRGELRPAAAPVPRPAQGDQGWVVPLRRQLLPALPTGGPSPADDRHRDEPHRLPLRPPVVSPPLFGALTWLPHYDRSLLGRDLLGGVTVSSRSIPSPSDCRRCRAMPHPRRVRRPSRAAT